jgi:GTPase SAR1 family protein
MSRKLKTCFLGDSSVGKTTIISRVVEGSFKDKAMPTIGLDFKSMSRTVSGKEVDV